MSRSTEEINMSGYSVLILAGEASGDYHAAALVRDLKELVPNITVTGIGGDRLKQAGMQLLHHYRELNTIGLSEGLGRLGTILNAYKTMKREIRSGKHQVFIPVDYPDVNLRLCRFARDAGLQVCYYVSPQVWAWRKGRIRKIARRVDHMMTLFPFEARLYQKAGVRASFVGHTMAREIPNHINRSQARYALSIDDGAYVVALVPGSRPAEIHRMLPRMCESAEIFTHYFPDTQFVLPLAADHLMELVNEILNRHSVPVIVVKNDASQAMTAADCGLVTSGTATLQAALVGMPHALVYVLDEFSWWLALRIIKPLLMDKDLHIGLSNMLSIFEEKLGRGPIKEMVQQNVIIPCQECGRPLFIPEILQHQATPAKLAHWLISFRIDEKLRNTMKAGFQQIREMLKSPTDGPTAAITVRDMLVGKNKGESIHASQ